MENQLQWITRIGGEYRTGSISSTGLGYEVGGCHGLFNSNDHLTLAGTGTVTPAQTITSP